MKKVKVLPVIWLNFLATTCNIVTFSVESSNNAIYAVQSDIDCNIAEINISDNGSTIILHYVWKN